MGDSGSLIDTTWMRAPMSCSIRAMDAPQEGADEELPVKESPCCHALAAIQLRSMQHRPDVSPRGWWACCRGSRVGGVGWGNPLLVAGCWPMLKL